MNNIIKCICNKEFDNKLSFKNHTPNCKKFKKRKEEFERYIINNYSTKIINAFKNGYCITDISKMFDIKYFISNYKDENNTVTITREIINKILKDNNINKFEYKEQQDKRRMNKIKKTTLDRYGVDNVGKLQSHKDKMKQKKYNPFASKEFSLLTYIKGKKSLSPKAFEYRKKVDKLTTKIKKQLGKPKFCYYTGLPITNNKKYDYNMFNYATIDHKISVLYGFNHDIPVEEIAEIGNICWCARFINILKKHMCEEEFINSEYMERFYHVKDDILKIIEENMDENKKNS